MTNRDYITLQLRDMIDEVVEEGLSLQEIAKHCGVSYSAVWKVMNTNVDFRMSTVCNIAEGLGYNVVIVDKEE